MASKQNKEERYVKSYFQNIYGSGECDGESRIVCEFLSENAVGRVLDVGCGPVPQVWSVCMPEVEEIYAVDLPKESVDFAKQQIAKVGEWYKNFSSYQKVSENTLGDSFGERYIIDQVSKIQSVQVADVSKSLPFESNYFDRVLSLYALGCLPDERSLKKALSNIFRVLKPGGMILHINTNGQNSNKDLPEFTWNGPPVLSEIIVPYLKKAGFTDIEIKERSINHGEGHPYAYNKIFFVSALKQ